MKYNGVFVVDPAFLDGDTILWKITGNGEYIIATKGGKKYFVKRNMHIRYPTKGLPKAVFDKYKLTADAMQKKQERLRMLMTGLDWTKDHIVVEEENFWDSEGRFITITPCISSALPDNYDFTSLSLASFLQLAKSVSEAVEKLHAHNVIHGDLKGKNIVVTQNGYDYVAYLIDFDSSYPTDEIPDWESIGGSEGYQSPEIMLYGLEEGAASKDTITTATDIFSLGVVFHKWWAGFFPCVDLEHGSVGAAVYLDKTVTIDKKFDVRIGDNCGATLKSLINWMFAKDPADRPTAKQVTEVLDDKLSVPEAFQQGSDEKPFDDELWATHKLVAEPISASDLKDKGVKSLKRINEGGGSASLKYRVVLNDGTERTMSILELCEAGYANGKDAEVDAPWDDHMIEFEPADVIAKKGYAKIVKVQIAFRKRYRITTVYGREIDKGYEWLIAEGLAHPKTISVEADTPWPEHGTAYCAENMARLGVKSISRMDVGGEHRYRIVYNQLVDGKNKVNEKVPVNNLKLMGFIK